LNRRDFVTALGSGAMLGLPMAVTAQQRPVREPKEAFLDVNVTLSHWPLRRLPCDETPALVKKLREHGVTSAWAGIFDGVLHKDIRMANARLAAECRNHGGGILVPFGSINPKLPDWEEDLRLCAQRHGMPGVRLYPNYHGYKLDEPVFARLMSAAIAQGLTVQIAVHLEDERMMHPLLRVEPVDVAALAEHGHRRKGARIVLLNALNVLDNDLLTRLLQFDDIYVEIATLEGVGGLERLLTTVPLERILFGSHAPFYYFESAKMKLRESALSPSQLAAIRYKNAEKLISAKGASS
jgi:predicted TIM-barrel fold metal-dependent hydrolase